MYWTEIDRIETHERGPYVVVEEAPTDGGKLVRIVGYTHDGLPSLGVGITFVPDPPPDPRVAPEPVDPSNPDRKC